MIGPVIFACLALSLVDAFPEQTRWADQPVNFTSSLDDSHLPTYHAVLFNNTEVHLKISCVAKDKKGDRLLNKNAQVRWYLRHSPCAGNYVAMSEAQSDKFLEYPSQMFSNENSVSYKATLRRPNDEPTSTETFPCDGSVVTLRDRTLFSPSRAEKDSINRPPSNVLPISGENLHIPDSISTASPKTSGSQTSGTTNQQTSGTTKDQDSGEGTGGKNEKGAMRKRRDAEKNNRIATTWTAGPYLLMVEITSEDYQQVVKDGGSMEASYTVEMIGPHGYLSILDYPLLIFYSVMCGVYVIFCIIWIVFCSMHWKDLLRVQFWIGAVIGMGLLEMAVFLGEYEHMNESGSLVKSAEMAAEMVSILKRTISRVLVIIVSLGFGIVKPRLGSVMNNVLAVGICYFVFASIEAGLRLFQTRDDPSTRALIAAIPLAVTDSIICWWIFTSLMTTLKNLKLRRNVVKLALYRHFFNALIFCVMAAVVYMLWSIKMHKMPACVSDWREIWIDTAYWQLLFALILCVIIFLWRPSQNNKRYAFSPLMDNEDDEMEEPMLENTNFDHVKLRNVGGNLNVLPVTVDKTEDDHLKWVEDNIPTAGFDTALPSLLDSDEEVMTTRLEMSKQR